MNHTPGPWRWRQPEPAYSSTELRGSDGDGDLVMEVYESHGGGQMPEPADRRLIAAAPEMFDLLKKRLDPFCPASVQDAIRALVARIEEV